MSARPGEHGLADTLMIQGTASGVGKSTLVAALCRLLRREGLRVAPFKAQNMSNNAAVAADGGEIGRAQAAQAEAAGVPSSVDMNPILLKPEAEASSQVVVRGRVWRRMSAREYHTAKPELLGIVADSLARLRRDYDVVVIEGAGSPAEVNLRASDLVNMTVAHLAGAPVLLAADIDRGGALAALVGTLALLEPEDRARVRGLVINRFRGDRTLLEPGLQYVAEHTGCPVLGVVPYLADLGLPEEDSQGIEQRGRASMDTGEPGLAGSPRVDVAVIRFPRLANFDDFGPLEAEPGVSVRYVSTPAALGIPDLAVLPGTKSTLADLAWLRASGLGPALLRLAAAGVPLLGICGGYQMLGRRLADPDGVEGPPATADGLGLLDVETAFVPDKNTRQVRGTLAVERGPFGGPAGRPLEGYEIHLGRTTGSVLPFARLDGNVPDGAVAEDGLIAGTYLHGLFHNAELRESLVGALAQRRGIVPHAARPATSDPYDRLADAVAASVDLRRLYEVCQLRLGERVAHG